MLFWSNEKPLLRKFLVMSLHVIRGLAIEEILATLEHFEQNAELQILEIIKTKYD